MSSVQPLSGLKVVDLSTWIAGGYCSKLLADAGASVIKVEDAAGDALRRWSASGAAIPEGANGALFNYLHAATEFSVVTSADELDAVLADAEVVVWSHGSALAEDAAAAPHELVRRHARLRVAAITPFGLVGPWEGRPATEFTLQAWSGAMVGLGRGYADRAPVYVGGQIGEWLAGGFAAVGVLASLRREVGEVVDVSMLEALATCLTYYPVTYHDQMGRPMRKKRFVPTPGVAAASDGMVGLGVGTGQQWFDFCSMIGHPEWTEDPKLFLERTALMPTIDAWIAEQKVDELLELASAFRIPNAPLVNGANADTFEHFKVRGTFVSNPIDGAANPGRPYRLTPAPGGHKAPSDRTTPTDPSLPLSGIRVLDMTAFWAGPFVGSMLGMLGAEVIHVESARRPDGARLIGGIPQSTEQFWERGPIFSALNTNKKSLTIDLSDPTGIDLLKQVVVTCDVVVENFTPRVLDQLGLSYEVLCESRPDLVMVRMPGFGLDGPWRDVAAFAFVIEDASGLTWLTGYPDLLPIEPYCVGDPNAGLHALAGLLVALAHRDRTGEGSIVEAAMVDAALSIAAEQVVEHSAYGSVLERAGNRGPLAAPQSVYQASGPDDDGRDDSWVAIAVSSDAQWATLRKALGDPGWMASPDLQSASGRFAAHERIDGHLAKWCRQRSADQIVALLWSADVPVAKVMQPHQQPDLAPLAGRGFFEELEHPVVGTCRYSTLPLRLTGGPPRLQRRHAPLLGEHNDELLAEIGLTREQIDALESDGVIGRSVTPAGAY